MLSLLPLNDRTCGWIRTGSDKPTELWDGVPPAMLGGPIQTDDSATLGIDRDDHSPIGWTGRCPDPPDLGGLHAWTRPVTA